MNFVIKTQEFNLFFLEPRLEKEQEHADQSNG